MKSFKFFILLYAGLTLLSCQDTSDHVKNTADPTALKNVGKEIPFETGMRWMDLYQTKNNSEGRLLLPSYDISATQLQTALNSVSNLTGVAFQYGYDDLGVKHIVVIPIDASLNRWATIPGRVLIDTNTGDEISQVTAQIWAQRYENANPGAVWFHYFGRNIFDDIQSISYFNDIDIEPALSDLDLSPQLLLIIWDESSLIGGREKGGDGGKVYDASNPCPPCEVQ